MDRDGDLSKLILRRVDTRICMMYSGVEIRCLNAPNTTTSDRNRALLTLSNAYIRLMNEQAFSRTHNPHQEALLRRSYNYLRGRINDNQLQAFSVYGTMIRPTELERYIDLTYRRDPEEYMIDVVSRILF